MKPLLFFILMLFSLPAFAGGDGELVNLVSFDLKADGKSYTLVVKPKENSHIYYFKGCDTFTVKGTFYNAWWEYLNNKTKNYSHHKQAINYLKNAKGKVQLSYMGNGFEQVGNDRCVVRSEALIFHSPNILISYIKRP